VPGWADAEAVVAGFKAKPGLDYTALWFNANGLERALNFRGKLAITGAIALTASEGFTRKNLNRSHAENVEAMRKQTALHLSRGVPVNRIGVMAAFGCNYQGDIAPAQVVQLEDGLGDSRGAGHRSSCFVPSSMVGRRPRVPARARRGCFALAADAAGIASARHSRPRCSNAQAGMRMGVKQFDSIVGGSASPVRRPKGAGGQHLHRGAGPPVRSGIALASISTS
jgi:hydroxymethylglutaryl-CoA lyase